jgi:YggT family protein
VKVAVILASPLRYGAIQHEKKDQAMLNSIVLMVVQTIASLLAGMCLLRAYMQWHGVRMGMGMGNAVAPWVMGLTDWLVLPLRRVLPKVGRIDLGSLMAAFLVMLLQAVVITVLFGAGLNPVSIVLGAVLDLLGLVLSSVFWLLVIGIAVSWLRVDESTVYWIQSLIEPLLRPVRRILPTVAGLDLSPMVLILLIKVFEMVLHGWRWSI